MNLLDRIVIKFLSIKYHRSVCTGKRAASPGRANWQADMTKLIIVFFATQRMHLRYLIVMSSGVHFEIKIFFSVIIHPLLKWPTLFFFFSFSRPKYQSTRQCRILAVHGITKSVRLDCHSSARPHFKSRKLHKPQLLLSQRLKPLVRA